MPKRYEMAKLQSNLLRIVLQAPKAAQAALEQTGKDIADLASQLAPVDTGALRDSYKSEVVSEGVVHVGTDVDYAAHVEFGTYKSAAQPHFTPAFKQNEDTFKARLRQELEKLT
jgi:HK97 gp10 family phage protein